jgi:sulfite exporter TauE/SafE
MRASNRQDALGRITLGACWGLIPCGLVYSVLMTAASTANAMSGAFTMLAFGAGTLPAMLGLTAAAPALASFLEDRTVRKLIGFALVVLAIWTILMMWGAMGPAGEAGHQHH